MKAIKTRIENEKDFEKLSEFEKFRYKKIENQRISKLYYFLSQNESDIELKNRYKKKSEEIENCGSLLTEYFDKNEKPPVIKYTAYFCHNRFCPLCLYKTSKLTFKLILDIVNNPKAKDCSFLFMTLTIKNCKESELPETITKLLKSYNKLITNKAQQFAKRFLGTFKVLESTYNKKNKTYHPHLHILVMIDKSYFKDTKKYLTKTKLIEIWQKALQVDYKPSVDIRATYNAESKTVAEVSKYTVKSSEIVNADILKTYDKAFYKRRLKSFTGLFREIKNDVIEQWKTEKTDCVDYETIMSNENFVKNLYRWNMFNSEFELLKSNSELKQEKIKQEKIISELINQIDFDKLDF